MKQLKVTIEGTEYTLDIEKAKDFIIDLDKAKSLGVLKEDPTIKDFNVGDVFLLASGSKVIIVQTGYTNIYESDIEQRYSFAGLGEGLDLFSSFGKEGGTKGQVLAYINNMNLGRPAKLLKNINKDISKLLSKLV